jgi:hypothetical protein
MQTLVLVDDNPLFPKSDAGMFVYYLLKQKETQNMMCICPDDKRSLQKDTVLKTYVSTDNISQKSLSMLRLCISLYGSGPGPRFILVFDHTSNLVAQELTEQYGSVQLTMNVMYPFIECEGVRQPLPIPCPIKGKLQKPHGYDRSLLYIPSRGCLFLPRLVLAHKFEALHIFIILPDINVDIKSFIEQKSTKEWCDEYHIHFLPNKGGHGNLLYLSEFDALLVDELQMSVSYAHTCNYTVFCMKSEVMNNNIHYCGTDVKTISKTLKNWLSVNKKKEFVLKRKIC